MRFCLLISHNRKNCLRDKKQFLQLFFVIFYTTIKELLYLCGRITVKLQTVDYLHHIPHELISEFPAEASYSIA